MLKVMCVFGLAPANVRAARNEPEPAVALSPVLVTTMLWAVVLAAPLALNSEVLPEASVAVALTKVSLPKGVPLPDWKNTWANEAAPVLSVVTLVVPMNVGPSP